MARAYVQMLMVALAPLVLATAPAAAANPAAVCADVIDYRDWSEAPGQQWDYRGAGLEVIGAEHSRDPSHAQFARIEARFHAARPTLLLFEGPDRGIAGDRDEAIRAGGESAFARLLARDGGIAARSLEPSPGEQMQMLMRHFPMDQVVLFFVLREAARLRDREGLNGQALDQAVAAMLDKGAAMATGQGMAMPFADLVGLQSAFARYWPGQPWQTAQSRWFDPLADDAQTGGRFMAAVNRASSNGRNRHLVRLLAEAVAAGERPFVVVGRNHVPMIAPALDCMLKQGERAAGETPGKG